MLAELVDHVVGVDPDRDWITLAVVDARSAGVIAEGRFPATSDGYLGQPLHPALRHPGLLPGRPPHDARHRHRRPTPLNTPSGLMSGAQVSTTPPPAMAATTPNVATPPRRLTSATCASGSAPWAHSLPTTPRFEAVPPQAIPAAGVRSCTQGRSPTKAMNDRRCAGGQVMDAGVGTSGIRPTVPASSWVNDIPCAARPWAAGRGSRSSRTRWCRSIDLTSHEF